MKVGVITFHFASNCGGMLQCFALQEFLRKNGCEASVIDYRPRYHTIRYDAVKNPLTYVRYYRKQYRDKPLARRAQLTARAFARCAKLDCSAAERHTAHLFRAFMEKNLRLTKKYTTLRALQADPPKADAYVTGSDQLWNPDLLDRAFDPAYFLRFGRADVPRVAYAVSTGKTLTEEECAQLHDLGAELTAVSIREYNRDVIDQLGKDVHICIDPTLLLDAADYAGVEGKQTESGPYIFVYGFEDTEEIHQAVKQAQEKYRCPVVNGCPHRIHLPQDARKMRDYGPDQFLTLVKNASCVVTNSFHGTAFSVVYRKDFITVVHRTRGGRMTELLGKLGLDGRIFGSERFSFEGLPDHDAAREKLAALRACSAEYLLEAVAGKKGEEIPHHEAEMG